MTSRLQCFSSSLFGSRSKAASVANAQTGPVCGFWFDSEILSPVSLVWHTYWNKISSKRPIPTSKKHQIKPATQSRRDRPRLQVFQPNRGKYRVVLGRWILLLRVVLYNILHRDLFLSRTLLKLGPRNIAKSGRGLFFFFFFWKKKKFSLLLNIPRSSPKNFNSTCPQKSISFVANTPDICSKH